MPSSAAEDWVSYLMGPTPIVITFTTLLVLLIPLLLHLLLYRSSSSTLLPCFLLIGPSGAGKTSLLTLVRMNIRFVHALARDRPNQPRGI